MESINNTPLLILRKNNKSFKARQKKLDQRVRSKKYLREQIYSNHNIFQSKINLYRNMTAQNLIWDKNYNFKCVINQIKQENSSLKARIWNVEKENRRMDRQIQAWNLTDYTHSNNNKKPYIDMATVEKVLVDQDYNIVSMKMHIFELQKQLQQRENDYAQLTEQIKNTPKLLSLLNHQIALKKVQLCDCIDGETGRKTQFERESKQKMSSTIMNQNQHLDLIAKNVQIKKKSKINIQNDLELVSTDCELQKQVTYAQIERLGQEIKKMRTEQDGGVNLQKQKLMLLQKSVLDYQCFMQQQMDKFIKMKIPIRLQTEKLLKDIDDFKSQQEDNISVK